MAQQQPPSAPTVLSVESWWPSRNRVTLCLPHWALTRRLIGPTPQLGGSCGSQAPGERRLFCSRSAFWNPGHAGRAWQVPLSESLIQIWPPPSLDHVNQSPHRTGRYSQHQDGLWSSASNSKGTAMWSLRVLQPEAPGTLPFRSELLRAWIPQLARGLGPTRWITKDQAEGPWAFTSYADPRSVGGPWSDGSAQVKDQATDSLRFRHPRGNLCQRFLLLPGF